MRQTGVYCIVNTHDGHGTTYIGSTGVSFGTRWSQHKHHLRNGTHGNPHLQNAWNKYGRKAFSFCVVQVIDDEDSLINREQFWLDLYKQSCDVYNIGDCTASSMRGRKHTIETKRKIARASHCWHANHTVSDEARERIRQSKLGKKRPPKSRETRLKQSRAMKGHKFSKEHRRKIGEANRRRTYAPQSEDAKRRISEALKGREFTKEHRAKIGTAHAGPYPSFINDVTGEVIPAGCNLSALCRKYELVRSQMRKVILGEKEEYRDWRLVKNEECQSLP